MASTAFCSSPCNVFLVRFDCLRFRAQLTPSFVRRPTIRGVADGGVPEGSPVPRKPAAAPAVTRLVGPLVIHTDVAMNPYPSEHDCIVMEDVYSMDTPLHNNDGNEQDEGKKGVEESYETDDEVEWEAEEIEAISSLFRGRIPQKPGKLGRERPLPLPFPYKIRPSALPTPKNVPKITQRQCISKRVYKNPTFLIGLAKQIKDLPQEEDVRSVLDECARFLRKGSLSMTVRELGHMGLPERALRVFCWAQNQPHLFPDDRILGSTVEVLARAHELKMPFNLDKFISLASKDVYEAMVKGFIKGGNLRLAWKLISSAKEGKRILDATVYVKLILDLGKNPDKSMLVLNLLEELSEREQLNLNQQDCTAVMKVCIGLQKFEFVEVLYDWFRKSGGKPSIVMYTTLVHSRFSDKKHREAMDLVWEMEASDCILDLPAYRVVIKLFAALNDLPRTVRYFSKLKEAGFSATFDIYRDVIGIYASHGRLAKCKAICKEAEMAGFHLDEYMVPQLQNNMSKSC